MATDPFIHLHLHTEYSILDGAVRIKDLMKKAQRAKMPAVAMTDHGNIFGAIDFLHHKIGSTHVAHHYDSSIPFYKAQIATDAIKKNFPEFYLYDPTPIPQALWRVCMGCVVVEKRGDKYIWKNDGLEDALSK